MTATTTPRPYSPEDAAPPHDSVWLYVPDGKMQRPFAELRVQEVRYSGADWQVTLSCWLADWLSCDERAEVEREFGRPVSKLMWNMLVGCELIVPKPR